LLFWTCAGLFVPRLQTFCNSCFFYLYFYKF
jgi:hypothetical protein